MSYIPSAPSPNAWYNFDTMDYDYRSDPPSTDAEALAYIPDHPAAYRLLYKAHRATGKDVLNAIVATLSAGTPPPQQAQKA